MQFSPEVLREMREAAGLRLKDLAVGAGVSASTVHLYESGRYKPRAEIWERILRLFFRRPGTSEYEFEVGSIYSIHDVYKGMNKRVAWNYNAEYGAGFVFEYEGKAGIHHIFREVKGGWTRTYTDAQLLGKRIKELKGSQPEEV